MQKELKILYRKDAKLAKQVAKVLGYEIKKKKAGIDKVIEYVSKDIFNLLNKAANIHGYTFKISAGEFEKFLNNLLAAKLR